MTCVTSGRVPQRSRISWIATPDQVSSSRLHPVTQWMSATTSVRGNALRSSYVSVSSRSTRPKTRRLQLDRSVFGTGPKWSSGQRSGAVSVWPGGTRAGSTPSGSRFRFAPEPIAKSAATRRLLAGDRERPAFREVHPVDRARHLSRVAGAGSERLPGGHRPLVLADLVAGVEGEDRHLLAV